MLGNTGFMSFSGLSSDWENVSNVVVCVAEEDLSKYLILFGFLCAVWSSATRQKNESIIFGFAEDQAYSSHTKGQRHKTKSIWFWSCDLHVSFCSHTNKPN